MPPVNTADTSFVFHQEPPIVETSTFPDGGSGPNGADWSAPTAPLPSPFDQLVGTWKGTGFNAIWRPHFPATQDRFLELNLTEETLVFSPIKGPIPNRGLLQADIDMFGVTYLQQISDSTDKSGLHIEPGIWAVVPQTTDPALQPTVVRMASIPHGTTILAQGTMLTVDRGPKIDDNDIIPFGLNGAPPVKSTFAAAEAIFPELDLSKPTPFRQTAPTISQQMVANPNCVLQSAVAGQNIVKTIVLIVATDSTPVPGGGTANTAFLAGGAPNASQANANASLVSAIFWIETIQDGEDQTMQLQYTQTVMLDFNGLRWPHVTVGTLVKQDGPRHGED